MLEYRPIDTFSYLQSDPQVHQFYPKINAYAGDLAKEPLLQLLYTNQLKEAGIDPNASLPIHAKVQSPGMCVVGIRVISYNHHIACTKLTNACLF